VKIKSRFAFQILDRLTPVISRAIGFTDSFAESHDVAPNVNAVATLDQSIVSFIMWPEIKPAHDLSFFWECIDKRRPQGGFP
jgi:hypothetical protein